MRPVHLTIEGLACFRDKQQLDFRQLELFAISGPTGAGKSTLLDAMIFALYGEIPRVNLQGRTEMISAARDRAVVVLDFDAGAERFRITRTLRRNGVQMVRLEQRDAQGEFQGVADQVRSATDRIEQILGLGAPAFMQAVVLPQGEFARFLKAPPRERRAMLRTLLRLDVYERMRERAHQLSVARRSAVESLRKLLADEYAGVDEAAVAELAAEHARVVEVLAGSRQRRDDMQAALARVQGLHARTQELRQVERRHAALLKQAEQVQSEQARLAAGARAAPLLPLLAEAAQAFGVATAAAQTAEQAQARAEQARQDLQARTAALQEAEKAARSIKKLRAQVARLHQVAGRLPERAQLAAAIERQTRDLAASTAEQAALTAAGAAARQAQAQHQAGLEAARRDALAAGYDPELDELLQEERDRAVELGAARRIAAERTAELAARRRAAEQLDKRVTALAKQTEAGRRAAARTQRGCEAAEQALARAVSLNEANHLREQLLPGEPCPVCEQPVDAPPAPHPAPQVDAARAALQQARDQHTAAEALARQGEAALAAEQAQLAAARQAEGELAARCAELVAGVAAAEAAIQQALGERAPQGGGVIEAWIERQIAALAKSRKADAEARARQAAAERALEQARAAAAAARERLNEKQAQQARLDDERAANLARQAAIEAEIRAVTRAEDPAAEAAAIDEQIQRIEADLKAATGEAAAAQSRLATAEEGQRLTAETALAALEGALKRAESRDAEIARAGFEDEAALRKALLGEAVAARLKEQVQRHLQESHAVEERLAALTAELGVERVSDQQLAAVEKLATELTAEVESALGREQRLAEQIGRMKERLARTGDLRDQLATEAASLRVHELLANDLRSDRFQAYLLQEVFGELVRGASARLLTLTGERYSLRFADDEIRVVDHDNAGETRISDTLSGGETFLTSLALALELSDQVQRAVGAVNLDSLFIDEGFGTLDPDTLSLVSETLQSLRVGGRMVGVITHIPELRDEFAQQVLVIKQQGYSTVEVRGSAD